MGKSPAWPQWNYGSSHQLMASDPSRLWSGLAIMPTASTDCPLVLIVSFSILGILLAGILPCFPAISYFWSHSSFTMIILPEQLLASWSHPFENFVSKRMLCSCRPWAADVESHGEPMWWDPLPQMRLFGKPELLLYSAAVAFLSPLQQFSHCNPASLLGDLKAVGAVRTISKRENCHGRWYRSGSIKANRKAYACIVERMLGLEETTAWEGVLGSEQCTTASFSSVWGLHVHIS